MPQHPISQDFPLDLSTFLLNYRWHFVTVTNKSDSVVTRKLREEEPTLPFLHLKVIISVH